MCKFVHFCKLVNNIISSPSLLAELSFHIPHRINRQLPSLFYMLTYDSLYTGNNPLSRMCELVKEYDLEIIEIDVNKFIVNANSILLKDE